MKSIILKRSQSADFPFLLAVRTHDPAETYYEPILRMTKQEAYAISGSHTGIKSTFDAISVQEVQEISKSPLMIEPVQDRAPGTRAWQVRIGDRLVTRLKEGESIPVRISDDHVRDLQSYSLAEFPAGEPDWDRRYVENLEDEAAYKASQAQKAIEIAVDARNHLESARDADRNIPEI